MIIFNIILTYFCVDHGGVKLLMPENLLYLRHIHSSFQCIGGCCVPYQMWIHPPFDPGAFSNLPHNSNYGKIPEGVFDLKNPPQYNMFVAGAGSTNIPPGLDGNACICFQQFPRDENYNALICFSFGADKIAIQRRRGADIWTDWKYFTAN